MTQHIKDTKVRRADRRHHALAITEQCLLNGMTAAEAAAEVTRVLGPQ